MSKISGTLTNVGDAVVLAGKGELTANFQLAQPASGTQFSGATVQFQYSPDGATWYNMRVSRQSDGVMVQDTGTLAAAGDSFVGSVFGQQCRARLTAISSGSVVVNITSQNLPMAALVTSREAAANVAPQASLNAATANGSGSVIDLGTCCRSFALQVVLTGGPSGGTVTLVGSLDGTNFDAALATFTIGTDASGVIKYVVDKPLRYVKAVLAGLTGGTSPTVTANVAAAA